MIVATSVTVRALSDNKSVPFEFLRRQQARAAAFATICRCSRIPCVNGG
jgi:hypothetical protein